jgi:hypothetical protein
VIDEPDDGEPESIDEVLDRVEMAAAEMLTHVKQAGVVTLELPVIDESGVWLVSVRRMGISEDEESSENRTLQEIRDLLSDCRTS